MSRERLGLLGSWFLIIVLLIIALYNNYRPKRVGLKRLGPAVSDVTAAGAGSMPAGDTVAATPVSERLPEAQAGGPPGDRHAIDRAVASLPGPLPVGTVRPGLGTGGGAGGPGDAGGPAETRLLLGREVPHIFPALIKAATVKCRANTPQWRAFKARLDAQLGATVDGGYQGSNLAWVSDFALGYRVLKDVEPVAASRYADKALAVLKAGMNDLQRDSKSTEQFLARGDGKTRRFTIPDADYSRPTLAVFLVDVMHKPYTKGAPNGQDIVAADSIFLRVYDEGREYVEGGDWRRNGDLIGDKAWAQIDWSPGGREPSPGSTYTLEFAYPDYQKNALASKLCDVAGTTITFREAPGRDKAVFLKYMYGQWSLNAGTGYRQTGFGYGGRANVTIDSGYTYRFLGKHIATGYDWLYDYPGFAADFEERVAKFAKK